MKSLVVAVALLAACRGGKTHRTRDDAGLRGSASAVSAATSVVPKLPRTQDGVAALRALDRRIQLHAGQLGRSVGLHLERAAITGQLEDYEQALANSAALVAKSPESEQTWRLRVMALLRVHRFADARVALKRLAAFVHPSRLFEYEIVLVEANGDVERALAMRAQRAKQAPTAQNLTVWAAALAQVGHTDDGLALIPKAAAAVRDNPPYGIAWLLFQWGRVHELKGSFATARELFAASHARLPGYVEATTHLAQAMMATGDRTGAARLVDEALAAEAPAGRPGNPSAPGDAGRAEHHRHPELLALAAQLGHPELADEARREWERYVAALPLAFSDHAARFYLTRDPARALELARVNHANRDTPEARALVVEAALAAGDTKAACAVVEPLVTTGTHAQRFLAWQALSRCGQSADAERLGRELGIVH